MSMIIIHQMTLSLFCVLLLLAAMEDVCDYIIPNSLVICLFSLFPLYFFTSSLDLNFVFNLSLAAAFFGLGMLLFSQGLMGGGDVKLIAVTVLWMGPEVLVSFILGMAITGGVMALFMMSPLRHGMAFFSANLGLNAVHNKLMTNQLPYGVAIAVGGIWGAYRLLLAS